MVGQASGAHVAPGTNSKANQWVRSLVGPKGARLDVADSKAAKALAGFARIHLRGSDAECTKQLRGFVKQLGLEALFAPPTPKSKERLMLMRALWQNDHAAAEELSKKGLDNVKPEEVREKLLAAGFSAERIAALSWQEVYPGHFTGIDPTQKHLMVEA